MWSFFLLELFRKLLVARVWYKLLFLLVFFYQVDLSKILSMKTLPLSQGVLLSLLQQLACDISNDTSRKLVWMKDVAMVINPGDVMIAQHVKPIFNQVYQILSHQMNLPTTPPNELSSIRLVMHIINSLLVTCSKWFLWILFFIFGIIRVQNYWWNRNHCKKF